MRATADARRSGSAGSRGSGRPWATSQNGQRRVQSSPMTMNVAVPCAKHSPRFGQEASSHTVTSRCRRRSPLRAATSGPTGARTRIQGGLRGRGPSIGAILTGFRAVLLAPDSADGWVEVDMPASMPALRPAVSGASRQGRGSFTPTGSRTETRALIARHTEETGQRFSAAAPDAVWTRTRGRPWLVNALLAGACFDDEAGRDRSRTIGEDDVYAAREELILSRRTHLDQLAHKLEEERVRRVVEPILSGGEARHHVRDLEYLRDLGLIDGGEPPRMANPIYAEVVPRELGYVLQSSLDVQAAWYVDDDGRLDLTKLLAAFRTFFREHSEHWLGRFSEYPEAGPQLILQAYLHRVVNGGGRIEREYGLGRGRTDLLVLWPREAGQPSDRWERFVVECKVLRDSDRKSLAGTIERGVEQTLGYMEKCGAEEGHLVVIDRRGEERRHAEEPRSVEAAAGGSGEHRQDGRKVAVWTL